MKTSIPSRIPRGLVALAAMSLALLLGCTQTRIYRVTIRNNTSGPVTVGFTKDGPPHEQGWASPEELTDVPPSRRPQNWGQVIDPAHKASTRVQGFFESGTHAFLRVYTGAPTTDEMVAMSRGTGTRADVLLYPNSINDFTVIDEGRITVHLTRP